MQPFARHLKEEKTSTKTSSSCSTVEGGAVVIDYEYGHLKWMKEFYDGAIVIHSPSYIFAVLFPALGSKAKVDAISRVVDDKYDGTGWSMRIVRRDCRSIIIQTSQYVMI